MMFTMQEPFYGILLSSMQRVPTNKLDTMGVAVSGNTFRLYYNPDYVNSITTDAALFCLKHEVLHTAFHHFENEKTMNVPKEHHELLNIAEDLEVNSYIDGSKVKENGFLFPDNYNLEPRKGTKFYYQVLLKKKEEFEQQQQMQAQQPQQPCNGGQGGGSESSQQQSQSNPQQSNSSDSSFSPQTQQEDSTGNQPTSGSSQSEPKYENSFKRFDDHSMWPTDESEEVMDMISGAVDSLIEFAAQEVEKACGTIPGEMVGRIEKIRRKPKPVTDWKRHFRRYLGNEFSELIRKSKKRESRRFPDAPGNKHRRKSHILVAIDTSGSISMPEYNEFFGQIKALTPHATFHVVECDTRIVYEYDYNGKQNTTLHGGGGTDFQPPVDLYNQNRRKYDALVYFTDGYCSIPHDTPKETLWVVSSGGDHDRKKYTVNGASVVFIPKKQ